MKSVYFTSMKVQHQPPLEFSLFFFLVLRCLSLVLLTFAWQGAGCLTLKSGIWAGNPQTASPPSSFSSCRAGICSIFQDKEYSPNLPAPPNPLLWMWFKSTQSVSVHCFHGQLENLRNEWKQTVTDQLNCILSSWQKRTPVGVPSSNRGGMNATADLVGEGKRRRETRNDLFTEQDVGYAREVKADWHPVTLPVMLVPVASGFLALLHRCHFVPPQQNICLLHFHCATDFSRILLGNGVVGLMLLLQLLPALFRTTATRRQIDRQTGEPKLMQIEVEVLTAHSFPEQTYIRSGRSKIQP